MCIGRSMYRDPCCSATSLSSGPMSTDTVVTNATARITAITTTMRRRMRRTRLVTGCRNGVSRDEIFTLLDDDQHGVGFDRHAFAHAHRGDGSLTRRAKLVLHLHRFDHDEPLTPGNAIAGLD